MDRRAIAIERRRRLVAEHIAEERGREASLADQLEEVVTELEGPAIDATVLEKLSPEDAAVARGVVQGGTAMELELDEDFFSDLEDDEEPYDAAADLEEELTRLQEAIATSQARQRSLEAYLTALDAG